MPFPVAAAAIMAGASLLGNLMSSSKESESREEGRRYLTSMQGATDSKYADILNDIGRYYDKRLGAFGNAGDVAKYRGLVDAYDPTQMYYTPGEFDEKAEVGSVNDYINPYYQQIIGDTAEQVQHTAAGAGVGRGSGAAYQIAKEVAEKNRELYNDAYGRYQDARDFAYGKYNDYIQNMQNALAQRRAAMDSKISLTGNLANDYVSTMDSQMSDMLKAKQDRIGSQTSYATAMAGLY
jgi:hypothetical protein